MRPWKIERRKPSSRPDLDSTNITWRWNFTTSCSKCWNAAQLLHRGRKGRAKGLLLAGRFQLLSPRFPLAHLVLAFTVKRE